MKCSTNTNVGCDGLGSYSCCAGSYSCNPPPGSAIKKSGRAYDWRYCVTQQDMKCDSVSVLCQRGTYWRDSACAIYCNEYSRQAIGCVVDQPGDGGES